MPETERYTLDTPAIIAYFTGEPGAGTVEKILVLAGGRNVEAYASFMTSMVACAAGPWISRSAGHASTS